MSSDQFVDYYELLQVSPNADDETIHRVFRHLAKQLHPDATGGETERFNTLVEAYRTLREPEARVAYDVEYRRYWERAWKLAAELSPDEAAPVDDEAIRDRLLGLFYAQRRTDMANPGIGELALGRMAECPRDLLEFHLWYLKEKGWVRRMENGAYAISADGVDRVEEIRRQADPTLLISTRLRATGSDDA